MYYVIRILSSSYIPKMFQGAQKPQIMYPAKKRTAKGKTLYITVKDKTKFKPAKEEFYNKMT